MSCSHAVGSVGGVSPQYANDPSSSTRQASSGVPAGTEAVSEEAALAMAAGARDRAQSDYAISVTGFADGPNAGHVFLGLATPTGTHARKLKLNGDRYRVRCLTVLNALDWLRRALADREPSPRPA